MGFWAVELRVRDKDGLSIGWIAVQSTHRLHSSSFLWLEFRIL